MNTFDTVNMMSPTSYSQHFPPLAISMDTSAANSPMGTSMGTRMSTPGSYIGTPASVMSPPVSTNQMTPSTMNGNQMVPPTNQLVPSPNQMATSSSSPYGPIGTAPPNGTHPNGTLANGTLPGQVSHMYSQNGGPNLMSVPKATHPNGTTAPVLYPNGLGQAVPASMQSGTVPQQYYNGMVPHQHPSMAQMHHQNMVPSSQPIGPNSIVAGSAMMAPKMSPKRPVGPCNSVPGKMVTPQQLQMYPGMNQKAYSNVKQAMFQRSQSTLNMDPKLHLYNRLENANTQSNPNLQHQMMNYGYYDQNYNQSYKVKHPTSQTSSPVTTPYQLPHQHPLGRRKPILQQRQNSVGQVTNNMMTMHMHRPSSLPPAQLQALQNQSQAQIQQAQHQQQLLQSQAMAQARQIGHVQGHPQVQVQSHGQPHVVGHPVLHSQQVANMAQQQHLQQLAQNQMSQQQYAQQIQQYQSHYDQHYPPLGQPQPQQHQQVHNPYPQHGHVQQQQRLNQANSGYPQSQYPVNPTNANTHIQGQQAQQGQHSQVQQGQQYGQVNQPSQYQQSQQQNSATTTQEQNQPVYHNLDQQTSQPHQHQQQHGQLYKNNGVIGIANGINGTNPDGNVPIVSDIDTKDFDIDTALSVVNDDKEYLLLSDGFLSAPNSNLAKKRASSHNIETA